MNIRCVHINGFGKLSQVTFEFGPGLNLLYGPNEAGKSSLMEAIKVLFYGFYKPGLKRAVLEPEYERYRPWIGQGYGGFIEYEIKGERFRLQRAFDHLPLQVQIVSLDRNCDLTSSFPSVRGEPQIGPEQLGLNKFMFVNTCWVGQGTLAPDHEFGSNLKDQLTSGLVQAEEIGFLAARQALRKALQEVGTDGASTKPIAFWRERVESLRRERLAVISRQDELAEVLARLRLLEQELERIGEKRHQQEEEFQRLKNQRLGYRWQEIAQLQYELAARRAVLPLEAETCLRAFQAEAKFEELWQKWRASNALKEQAQSQVAKLTEHKKRAEAEREAAQDLSELLLSWQELQWEFSRLEEYGQPLCTSELKMALMTEQEVDYLLELEKRIDRLRLEEHRQPRRKRSKALVVSFVLGIIGAIIMLGPAGDFNLIPEGKLNHRYLGGGILALAGLAGLKYLVGKISAPNGYSEQRALLLQAELEAALQKIGVRYPSELKDMWQQACARQEQELARQETGARQLELLKYRVSLEEQLRTKFIEQQDGMALIEPDFKQWLQDIQVSKLRNQVDLERMTDEEKSWTIQQEKYQVDSDCLYTEIFNLWQEAGVETEAEFRQKVYRGKQLQKDQYRVEQAEEILGKLLEGDSYQEVQQRWFEAGQPDGGVEIPESSMLRTAEELAKTRAEFSEYQAELLRMRSEYRHELNHSGRLEQLDEDVRLAEQELKVFLRQRKALELADAVLAKVEARVRDQCFPRWTETVQNNLKQFSGGRYQELHWTEELLPQLVAPEDKRLLNVDQVSAGTRDLIHLALRFSLADHIGTNLPIFLDDPFVELDELRWQNIAQLLLTAGTHRQVILFTCHQREKEFFQEAGVPVQTFG